MNAYDELVRLREDIAAAKNARKSGSITAERYYQDLAEYEADERRLIKERNAWQRKGSAVQGKPIDMEKEWARLDITLTEKRAYVERAFSAIIVHPAGKGSRIPLRDRLEPIPNTEI